MFWELTLLNNTFHWSSTHSFVVVMSWSTVKLLQKLLKRVSVPDNFRVRDQSPGIFKGSVDLDLPKFSYSTTQCDGSGSQLSQVFDPRPTLIWNTEVWWIVCVCKVLLSFTKCNLLYQKVLVVTLFWCDIINLLLKLLSSHNRVLHSVCHWITCVTSTLYSGLYFSSDEFQKLFLLVCEKRETQGS